MTAKMWLWAAVLASLAALDLSATLQAHRRWDHSAAVATTTTTLGQVLGFVSSGLLAVGVVLILITGLRSTPAQRSYRREQRLNG